MLLERETLCQGNGSFFSSLSYDIKCALGLSLSLSLSIHKGSSDFDGLLIFTCRLVEEEIFPWWSEWRIYTNK